MGEAQEPRTGVSTRSRYCQATKGRAAAQSVVRPGRQIPSYRLWSKRVPPRPFRGRLGSGKQAQSVQRPICQAATGPDAGIPVSPTAARTGFFLLTACPNPQAKGRSSNRLPFFRASSSITISTARPSMGANSTSPSTEYLINPPGLFKA